MKTFLLLSLISFFVFSANGQDQEQVDPPNLLPLSLTFELKENKFCFEGVAEMTAKLTNVSVRPIVVDLNKIGAFEWFGRIDKKPEGKFFLSEQPTVIGLEDKPDYIILQPKEFFTKKLEFIFSDSFFKGSQKYLMHIGYKQSREEKFENIDVWRGSVGSNQLKILVKNCR